MNSVILISGLKLVKKLLPICFNTKTVGIILNVGELLYFFVQRYDN